ncbi:nitroreductase family protein [Clostridium sp. C2-6-12]|uniref:nitroreductase family protein n=1 Tax=Clostridium sp. C2-6-12 TaxID=2698832 RepID=UPI00136F6621|nr:nitroreductase family protein [Clostridium sp. C2-6-12]
MELNDAIEMRCSRRTYIDKPIDDEKIRKLEKMIKEVNKEGNLHLQLVLNDGKAFQGIRKSYGLFKGVRNYIALVGKEDKSLREKIGYYGERVVLEATRLGLGTCWVGGSFDKKSCNCIVEDGEVLIAVIAIGNIPGEHTLKEKIILKAVRGKSKKVTEMYEADEEVPSWFEDGMKAVQKAPSAMNKQPVKFYYKNSIVTAVVHGGKDYQEIDLGIAKLHFEIGARGGKWQWGNGTAFIKV